jgi:hypothetical protein
MKRNIINAAPYGEHKIYIQFCKKSKRYFVHIFKEGKFFTKTTRSRYIMEVKLGRLLDESEDVHHIDEDTTNDKIDNLEVKSKTKHLQDHKTGVRLADRITCICAYCKKVFESEIKHCNRRIKKNQETFCSIGCCTSMRHARKLLTKLK